MQIRVNGAVDEIGENASINDVLIARKLPVETVIIVLNDEIISRGKWESLKLNPEDNLEVIRVIGGG